MTALFAIAIAGGTLLMFSALINQPMVWTFQQILAGHASMLAEMTQSNAPIQLGPLPGGANGPGNNNSGTVPLGPGVL